MEALRWISVTTSLASVSVVWAEHPIIDTQYGRLRGVEMTSDASTNSVMAFLGVPYAQPPVGDLRFALPQPVSPWEGIRDAIEHCLACPQDEALASASMSMLVFSDRGQSEDCLYLDVFTPGLDDKRPVLVVIHGGGFVFGQNTMLINGEPLAALGAIVVVSLNYRLGALGNLYDAEGAWPSNLGLRDQQFALRWVQDNIAAFGGDPDTVTLNGESAGSVSVSAQILAASSRGLFHRAISQSGSIFSAFRIVKHDPQLVADYFAASLDCSIKQPAARLACLRKKSVEEIIEAQGALPILMWDQVWDGDFLPSDPYQAYSEGAYSKVDLISGVTSSEGFVLAPSLCPELLSPNPDIGVVEQQLATSVSHISNDAGDVDHLLGEDRGKDADYIRQRVVDILGEYTLQASTYLTAELHSADVENSYFFEFAHKPTFMTALRPPWHRGCDHAMDMIFVFGFPFVDNVLVEAMEPFTDDERTLSKLVMSYIANFVKTGNPNAEGLPLWKPFSVDDKNYQILHSNIENGKNFKAEAMEFWGEKIRDLGKFDVKGLKRDEL